MNSTYVVELLLLLDDVDDYGAMELVLVYVDYEPMMPMVDDGYLVDSNCC